MQGVLWSRQATGESSAAPAEDADLVALAQANPRAFEQLYRRYVDAVHRYCYRRLGSQEAAEDATSVVFTKAFAALPSYRGGSFRSWLFTIAYHAIADDLRARRPAADLDAAHEIADREPSPEDLAFAAEADRSVAVLLAYLPDGQREIVELRLAGLNGREIAETLGRGLPAVKIAQMRAYKRLRDLLASEGREEGRDGRH